MKRIIVLLAFLVLLAGCPLDFGNSTFDTVSAPYLRERGQPEDVYEYRGSSAYLIDWWWWSQGFQVTFSNWNAGATKASNGWQVESEYSFPPIP